jgi:hypothetical protein
MDCLLDFVFAFVSEKGVHMVVFDAGYLDQEAVGVTAGHAVAIEEDLRVLEGDYFVLVAVDDHQKGVDVADAVEDAEAVVVESRVGRKALAEEGVDGGHGGLQDDTLKSALGRRASRRVGPQAEPPEDDLRGRGHYVLDEEFEIFADAFLGDGSARRLAIARVLVDHIVELGEAGCEEGDEVERVGEIRGIAVRIDDCTVVLRAIFEVEADGVDLVMSIFH